MRGGGIVGIAGIIALAGCAGVSGSVDAAASNPPVPADAALAPRLPGDHPSDERPFFPSQLRLVEEHADVELLADVATCAQCHADAAAQHAVSAHARSSFDNPWYRAVIERLRADVGEHASRHCAGCHDPLMLVAGTMDRPIDPTDPATARLASAGVTCLVCHGIVETRSDGNASYTLSTAPVPLPDPNDAEQVAAHRARVAPSPLRTPGLCGSCHRGFLGTHTGGEHFLPGIDEIGPWRGSAWGDQHAQRIDDVEVPEGECRGCHMPDERVRGIELGAPEGRLASHRFAGGHSALAAASGDAAQVAAVTARQRSAATLDVIALPVANDPTRLDGVPDARGERLRFDVVIRNVGTGHSFPGGARDLRDHWVEVRVRDARGRIVGAAGVEHEHHDDPTAFVLGTAVLDEDGRIEREHLVHRFRVLGWDHTIPPRDARAVRYAIAVPRDAALPLTIEATLRARRHHAGVRALGCASSRSERGRAFDEGARLAGSPVIDGCADEPVIELAAVVVGAGASERPAWQRLYEHGMALSHDAQERVESARPSLEAALSVAPDARARAQILLVLADVAASQGRRDEALALTGEIEAAIGAHPAIDRVRGRAAAQVWRWEDAAEAFADVARAAPLDTAAHRDLARALGSLDRPRDAWAASLPGLRLQPRDESLLRSQALALAALEDGRAGDAQEAFLRHRREDAETALRARCDALDPTCARDRLPIPTIEIPTLFRSPPLAR